MGPPLPGTAMRPLPQAPGRPGQVASATSSRCRSWQLQLREGRSMPAAAQPGAVVFELIVTIAFGPPPMH